MITQSWIDTCTRVTHKIIADLEQGVSVVENTDYEFERDDAKLSSSLSRHGLDFDFTQLLRCFA